MRKHKKIYTYLAWGISLILLIVNILWFLWLFGFKAHVKDVFNSKPHEPVPSAEPLGNSNAPVKLELVCTQKASYCCDLYTKDIKTKLYRILLQLNESIKDIKEVQFNGRAFYENSVLILFPREVVQVNGRVASFCIVDKEPMLAGFQAKVVIQNNAKTQKISVPLEIKLR